MNEFANDQNDEMERLFRNNFISCPLLAVGFPMVTTRQHEHPIKKPRPLVNENRKTRTRLIEMTRQIDENEMFRVQNGNRSSTSYWNHSHFDWKSIFNFVRFFRSHLAPGVVNGWKIAANILESLFFFNLVPIKLARAPSG